MTQEEVVLAPQASLAPALDTLEAVVIDGANSVGGAPRQHFPQATGSGLLGASALVGALLLLRRRGWAPRLRRWVLLGALLAAALPGLVAVFVARPDAPARRPALARVIVASLQALQARTGWPRAAVVVLREDDGVWFPLGRYAVPGRPPPIGPAIELELGGPTLAGACRAGSHPGRVICGAEP